MAGGTITTGNIPRLLQDGLNKVFGQTYDEHSTEWDKIFDTSTSKKNFELDQQYEGFGLAPEKPEGQDVEFDSASQGFTPQYKHITYAKGFIVTQEAMEDELYGVFKRRARSLAFSMQQTKETIAANILNNGFDSSYLMTGGDGVELFSTAHLNGPSGGTYSNELATPADLSEASIEDLIIQIGNATDPRGLKIAIKPTRLIVPVALAFEAQRIMGSVLQNDTSNNATNALKDMNAIPGGHVVNHYLTDTDAWFIKTDCGGGEGLKHFTRRAVSFGEDNAFTSGNARMKADERYSFGWTDSRGCYGSAGA